MLIPTPAESSSDGSGGRAVAARVACGVAAPFAIHFVDGIPHHRRHSIPPQALGRGIYMYDYYVLILVHTVHRYLEKSVTEGSMRHRVQCVFIHVFYAVHTAAGTDDHGSEVRAK